MKYVRFLIYLFRHKFYVLLECAKHGLWIRGILHDWTKLLPNECLPYARTCFSAPGNLNYGLSKSGFLDISYSDNPEYYMAVAHHQKTNRHHWQYWVWIDKNGQVEALPMDAESIIEMVADWRGAAKARNTPRSYLNWYQSNKDKIFLHTDTRKKVEELLFPVVDVRLDFPVVKGFK